MDTIDTSMSPTIYVVSQTDDGPHRRPIVPGRFTAADTWEATDISAESEEVQSACTSAWTDEAVAAFKTLNPFVAVTPPPRLPDLLPYQFRAMLALSGKQADLDAYVTALPDPQKTIAQAKLDYSLTFRRDNDLVLAAQQALGLTDAQLDAMWTQAAAIT